MGCIRSRYWCRYLFHLVLSLCRRRRAVICYNELFFFLFLFFPATRDYDEPMRRRRRRRRGPGWKLFSCCVLTALDAVICLLTVQANSAIPLTHCWTSTTDTRLCVVVDLTWGRWVLTAASCRFILSSETIQSNTGQFFSLWFCNICQQLGHSEDHNIINVRLALIVPRLLPLTKTKL